MAIDPNPKNKKRIKVKVKGNQSAPEIPSGFERSPERSKPGKDVYIRKTEKTEVSPVDEGQGREATAEEKKAMVSGSFYGPNQAQYREPKTSTTTSKEEMVVKKKEPKSRDGSSFAEKVFGPKEDWILSGKNKGERQTKKAIKKSKSGAACPVGRGRISKARY